MSKTKVLRYLKVMIPKFCPVGHLILIFIRILPPPGLFELSKGKLFLKQIEFGATVFY